MPTPPATLRLSSPAEIVTLVPYLVGFRPADSLVAISLRGPRLRVGLTMRADLAGAPEERLVDDVVGRLAHDGASEVLLVVYCAGGLSRRTLVDRVRDGLGDRDIGLRDALHVADDRWWSYLCVDADCCPPEGTPAPDIGSDSAAGRIAAEMTYNGVSVLPSRQALVDSLRTVQLFARASMEQAIARAYDEAAQALLAGGSRDDLRPATLELAAEVRRRYDEGHGGMTDDEAATLIVALSDVHLRDVLLLHAAERARDDAGVAMLRELVRRAIPPDDAAPAGTLAALSYLHGDGALASIAAERALASDPDYGLAQIVLEALDRNLSPSQLRDAWLSCGRQVRRLGYGRRAS